jgi:hypothetical protein
MLELPRPGWGPKSPARRLAAMHGMEFLAQRYDQQSLARRLPQFEICCTKTELAVNEFCGIRKSFEAGCGIRILAMANFAT